MFIAAVSTVFLGSVLCPYIVHCVLTLLFSLYL